LSEENGVVKHELGRRGALGLSGILLGGAVAWAQIGGKAATTASSETPGVAESAAWFKVQSVAEGVWRIFDDHGAGNAYLVTGRDRALLIDTGTGAADLAGCVRGITTLPVTVVNTHGHSDHAGGNFQFETASAHPDAFEMIVRSAGQEGHADRIRRVLAESPALEPLLLKAGGEYDQKRLVPVRSGHVFDLGARKLEVIETPGHTSADQCLLDAEHKLLFAGDAVNAPTWLFKPYSLPVDVYLETLQRLRQRGGEYETILPGHGDPLDRAFIDEQVVCAESILSGACKGEPYPKRYGDAMACSYKRSQIAYDPERLRARQ
jgi:hydroxyacylglutathione hydrolase